MSLDASEALLLGILLLRLQARGAARLVSQKRQRHACMPLMMRQASKHQRITLTPSQESLEVIRVWYNEKLLW